MPIMFRASSTVMGRFSAAFIAVRIKQKRMSETAAFFMKTSIRKVKICVFG